MSTGSTIYLIIAMGAVIIVGVGYCLAKIARNNKKTPSQLDIFEDSEEQQ